MFSVLLFALVVLNSSKHLSESFHVRVDLMEALCSTGMIPLEGVYILAFLVPEQGSPVVIYFVYYDYHFW